MGWARWPGPTTWCCVPASRSTPVTPSNGAATTSAPPSTWPLAFAGWPTAARSSSRGPRPISSPTTCPVERRSSTSGRRSFEACASASRCSPCPPRVSRHRRLAPSAPTRACSPTSKPTPGASSDVRPWWPTCWPASGTMASWPSSAARAAGSRLSFEPASHRRAGAVVITPGNDPVGAIDGPPPDRLLVIDQFEELFTLCPDEGVRREFVDKLLARPGTGGHRPPRRLLRRVRQPPSARSGGGRQPRPTRPDGGGRAAASHHRAGAALRAAARARA